MGRKTRSKCNCMESSENRGCLGFMKFLQFFLQQFEMIYETLRNFKRDRYCSKGQLLPPVIKDMDFRTLSIVTLTLAASGVERWISRFRLIFLSSWLFSSISLTSFHPERSRYLSLTD